ncbi:MAG: CinA family protein [Mailhella sp.]|nr:CinA family protein [Mailhella sp.]
MFEEDNELVSALGRELLRRSLRCATAESCTGGLIGAMLTAVPGSSAWYAGGVVSYANDVKERLLGVQRSDLETCGAVSGPVVRQMALGACAAAGADAAMAVSGVAGPGGATEEKPVGTVWIGWALRGDVHARVFRFPGSRGDVRSQAARCAIGGLLDFLLRTPGDGGEKACL